MQQMLLRVGVAATGLLLSATGIRAQGLAAGTRRWSSQHGSALHVASATLATSVVARPAHPPTAGGFFNVRDFGARTLTDTGCDATGTKWVGAASVHVCGEFDSAPAVQAAVRAAVAAGRGTVVFPSGRYGTYSTIDLTRPAEADLSIIGDNATLEVLAPRPIEAIFKVARTGSQAANRHHAEFRGLRLKGGGRAFYGLRVVMNVGSDVVSINNVYVEGCGIGVDLEAVMESHVSDLTLFSNAVGLRLRPDRSGKAGGGNANDFVGVKITGGQVGVLLYQDGDRIPFHNNTFTGTLVQGMGVAGIVVAGELNYSHTFIGGHLENGLDPAQSGPVEVGDFGAERKITVRKADVVLLSGEAKLIALSPDSIYAAPHADVEPGRSTKLPRLAIDGGSIGGNAGTRNAAFEVFESSDVVFDYVRIISRHGVARAREFYRSTVVSEVIPPLATPGSNQMSTLADVRPPATATSEVSAIVDKLDVITFAKSPGGLVANAYRRPFSSATRAGQFAYVSAVLRATVDTTVVVGIAGDGMLHSAEVPLRTGRWTYVRMISSRCPTTVRPWLVVYPRRPDGATVRIARAYGQNVDEPTDAATLFNGGAFID